MESKFKTEALKCSYYRRFTCDYAKIAKALTLMMCKSNRFEWTETRKQAFDQLRDCLRRYQVLAYPWRDGLFILNTNASLYGMEVVLSQILDG